jgi:hypothetical protein
MMYPHRADAAARRLTGVLGILNQSATIADALPELQRHDLAHTEDAVRMMLRRADLGKVSDHLGTALEVANRDFVDRVAEVPAENDDGPPTLQGGFEAMNDERPVFRERRGLIVPDSHWPMVDRDAWNLMLRVGRFFQPDDIVTQGDQLDMYCVSSHDKSPTRAANLADELAESVQCVDDLDSLGATSKHWLDGNHENRLNRFIANKAPQLHGMPGTTVDEILSLRERGWTHSKYMVEHIVCGHHFSHDYGQAGKYAISRALNTLKVSLSIGHVHRSDEAVAFDPFGNIIRAYCYGWLGSFDGIDYMSRAIAMRDWAHGCGVYWTQPDNTLRIERVKFVNGVAKVEGQAC